MKRCLTAGSNTEEKITASLNDGYQHFLNPSPYIISFPLSIFLTFTLVVLKLGSVNHWSSVKESKLIGINDYN